MRNRKLDDLKEPFRSKAFEFLARLTEANIPVFIVETLRSEEQHRQDLANGVSWAVHSKHQDGLAIDIDPYGYDWKPDWNADDLIWQQIGEIGESLGLIWGGRWKQRDMGHFEMLEITKTESV